MLTKISGIVLKTVRHNDRSNIITLFTRERGRVSFVSSAGAGKASRRRNAILSPLAVIETEVNFHENRRLQILGNVTTPYVWNNIYFDPMRSAMALFLSEFLNQLLNTQERDAAMWNYLIYSLHYLNSASRGLANYHIAFLLQLLPIMGIQPDTSDYRQGRTFDMREGRFSDFIPPHPEYLNETDAQLIPTMQRMNFRNMHLFKFNVAARRRILDIVMRYFSIHLSVKETLKSLDILKELF